MQLKQLIPQGFCLECQGCCRFKEERSIWQPASIEELLPYKDFYICPNFLPKENRCIIYHQRPLDCQLYPFLLHRHNGKITLAIDKKCPFIEKTPIKEYTQYLIDFLSQAEIKDTIKTTPQLINDYQDEALIVCELKELSLDLELKRLQLEDKPLIDRYIGLKRHNLSVYSFVNIFIWSGHFDIFYKIIDDNFCVFFKDKTGIFLYLPPLGDNFSSLVIKKVFEIMDEYNINKDISRIENIQEADLDFYKSQGLKCVAKDPEYVYKTDDIANYAGNKFKSQRASYNFFTKNYKFQYLDYNQDMKDDCLWLIKDWIAMRKSRSNDFLYNSCLDDSFLCQKIALDNYKSLDLIGRVVKIDDKASAFSLGYKLNEDTLCILFEVCNIAIKGLSEFIFSRVAQEFSEFKFVNCLDDSGFANLKRHKLLYQPFRLEPSYIAKRLHYDW